MMVRSLYKNLICLHKMLIFHTHFQVCANNILLLHLGFVNSLLCTQFLVFSVPSIARNEGNLTFGDTGWLCIIHGCLMTAAHPVALWTICCLNCDRYYAIAAPLHYGAIVNTKKVSCVDLFLIFILIISFTT